MPDHDKVHIHFFAVDNVTDKLDVVLHDLDDVARDFGIDPADLVDDEHDDVTLEHLIQLHHQLDAAPIDQYRTILDDCLHAIDRAHPDVVAAFARHRHTRTRTDR